MSPFHIKNDDIELACSTGADGIIHLTMAGNVRKDTIHFFTEWASKVQEAMVASYKRDPDHVLTLVDTNGLKEIDFDSIDELTNLMKFNKQYVTKTAVHGANYFVSMILDMALHVTKRNNLKIFHERSDALSWLMTEKKS